MKQSTGIQGDMSEGNPFTLCGQTMILLPEKAIFWKEEKSLLISDLHLGKANHFRKHGIAVPTLKKNLIILGNLLRYWNPERVIFLGDLFHSAHNAAWESFCDFLASFSCSFELVKGNHDILSEEDYRRANLKVFEETLTMGPFLFSHIPFEKSDFLGISQYVLAGHVHPGIRLLGSGRQNLRLPCFWFGKQQGLLPAFGEFTGLHVLKPDKEDSVFAIAEDEVVPVGKQQWLNF